MMPVLEPWKPPVSGAGPVSGMQKTSLNDLKGDFAYTPQLLKKLNETYKLMYASEASPFHFLYPLRFQDLSNMTSLSLFVLEYPVRLWFLS